jgi:hypothetical protein
VSAEGLVESERPDGRAMHTVGGSADTELTDFGGHRAQHHLPLLTDALVGGQSSRGGVCRWHADDDPLGGLACGIRCRGRGKGKAEHCQSQPQCLGEPHKGGIFADNQSLMASWPIW